MSGATTTSGLAWKLPGRVGDSPIIGAGCYTDQDVGSAGATGSGEENIKVCGAHTIVENMRRGMTPQEAGMDALKRIVRNYNDDMSRLKYVDMTYYILRKDGAYAGVCCGAGTSPASRTRSPCTTERSAWSSAPPCSRASRRSGRRCPTFPQNFAKARRGRPFCWNPLAMTLLPHSSQSCA